jgi:hypothetical protein
LSQHVTLSDIRLARVFEPTIFQRLELKRSNKNNPVILSLLEAGEESGVG